MNEKKLAKILKEGVRNNKIKTGYKEVLQYIKGTKLIILSKTLTTEKEENIKKSAGESSISVISYPGNSVLLGRLCSLSYGTSVVSLKNVSDEEVKELISS
jgi:large subunit ribosomal protein L30e